MKTYFYHIKKYFEVVLHPAEGKMKFVLRKKKSASRRPSTTLSPDEFNLRGGAIVKSEHFRRSPAP